VRVEKHAEEEKKREQATIACLDEARRGVFIGESAIRQVSYESDR